MGRIIVSAVSAAPIDAAQELSWVKRSAQTDTLRPVPMY